jgi:hypothetical protein
MVLKFRRLHFYRLIPLYDCTYAVPVYLYFAIDKILNRGHGNLAVDVIKIRNYHGNPLAREFYLQTDKQRQVAFFSFLLLLILT